VTSVVLFNGCFYRNWSLRLNRSWEGHFVFCIMWFGSTIKPPTTNCRLNLLVWCPTAFCRQTQLKQDNGNGLGQRSDTLQLNGIHLCGVTAGNVVLLRYSRQLVGW